MLFQKTDETSLQTVHWGVWLLGAVLYLANVIPSFLYKETIMNINNISSHQPMKPNKPAEPVSPPGGNIENRQSPSEPSAPAKPTEASTKSAVNYTALRSLQEILNDYSDVSRIDENKRTELSSRLRDSGFLEPGALINIVA